MAEDLADRKHRLETWAGCAVQVALALVLAWLLLSIVGACMTRSPEFDGAMNLLVSRSIAEGHGPREVYDSGDLFPPGVQTKEPYVLLGALVFEVFGVGPLQIELPNLIYLLLLCITMAIALRRMFDTTTALVASVLLLGYPLLTHYGLRGYGELPTLFFGLAALAIVSWPGPWSLHLKRRCLLAGALAGLALATKVVGIVQVGTVGIVLLCRLLTDSSVPRREILRAPFVFAFGVATPLLLVEMWRLYWLGTAGYRAWWSFQWSSIVVQSGAAPAQAQTEITTKVVRHFQVLTSELGMDARAVLALLIAPFVALGFVYIAAFDRAQRSRCRWWLLGLSLLVALYFTWWLAVVPDDKAWVRYIYIGLISVAILAAIAFVASVRHALASRSTTRLVFALLAVILASSYAPAVSKALKPIQFKPDAETINTRQAAHLLSLLPTDAVLLGYGWYAAPSVQIYVSRPFLDLTDWPIGKLLGKPAYLIADRPTIVTGMLDRTLKRYPHRALLAPNAYAQVYEMNFADPVDPFANADQTQSQSSVTFAEGDYPLVEGMEPFDPIGGRFIESDSEILLRYDGKPSIQVTGYMDAAQPSHYRWPGALDGRLIVGNCPPMAFRFDQPGWRTFNLRLNCKPPTGRNVRVRILLDNVFDWPLLKDRQRALLLGSVAFSNGAPP